MRPGTFFILALISAALFVITWQYSLVATAENRQEVNFPLQALLLPVPAATQTVSAQNTVLAVAQDPQNTATVIALRHFFYALPTPVSGQEEYIPHFRKDLEDLLGPDLANPPPVPTALGSEPTRTSTPEPTPQFVSGQSYIEASWPRNMQLERADAIVISLIRTTDVVTPSVRQGVDGRTTKLDVLVPVGTPGAGIESAFGKTYEASATVKLEGLAFKIQPEAADYQSLAESRVTWAWNVMPQIAGRQTLNIDIDVRWQSSDKTIERRVWTNQIQTEVGWTSSYFLHGIMDTSAVATILTTVVSLGTGALEDVFGLLWRPVTALLKRKGDGAKPNAPDDRDQKEEDQGVDEDSAENTHGARE
ncbi:MAG TPA: hypothetical protein VGE04_02465 [Chloroflexia bacterium]|jgi:hypothetical protein